MKLCNYVYNFNSVFFLETKKFDVRCWNKMKIHLSWYIISCFKNLFQFTGLLLIFFHCSFEKKSKKQWRISEYQWFNTSKHVLMCFYYLWITKIKMHWQLEICISLCLCLRCMLKQNSNWNGDPLPFHSHPEKKHTCLSACFVVRRTDQTVG